MKGPASSMIQFIYQNVAERNQVIILDDCIVNLDFEFFLSQITRGVTVNPNGLKRFKIDAPKFIFSTNHAVVNGGGNSFEHRQYYIGFSDYYNKYRTPANDLGRLMFYEWDFEQWNYFYNFLACCVQTYLRYPDLNTYTIPTEDVNRRQLRQRMSEEFLEFMEVWLGDKINKALEKNFAMNAFLQMAPMERRYLNGSKFKLRIKAYCEYTEMEFNPGADKAGRIRSGQDEFILIATNDLKRTSGLDYIRSAY